ncbi:MAG: DUF58 domain-containing protein [Leadbetterella sp.]
MASLDLEKIRQYGGLEFLAKQMVEGFITGLHRSPFHGFSVEFAEHKMYNSGESTRHLDWKVFAKTDKLFTKKYEEETNLRCHILLDVSASMYYPKENNGKLAFSALAAGVLANMLQKQRDAVSLLTFSDTIHFHSECKSTPTHIHSLFRKLNEVLESKPKEGDSNISDTIHAIADKVNRRSLVVIFSDMFENINDSQSIFSALQHLKHNKHEILLFHVTDQSSELDFSFEERPYEFIDVETGEKVQLQPSQVRETYIETINNFKNELKIKAGQYKIDFVEVDVNQGFDSIMGKFLTKRRKMA